MQQKVVNFVLTASAGLTAHHNLIFLLISKINEVGHAII